MNELKFANKHDAIQFLSDLTHNVIRIASTMKYLGQCDKLRKTPDGEEYWQKMMKDKKPISINELESTVDINAILDEDETIRDFIAADPDAQAYKSAWGDKDAKFLQYAGFEFIWTN